MGVRRTAYGVRRRTGKAAYGKTATMQHVGGRRGGGGPLTPAWRLTLNTLRRSSLATRHHDLDVTRSASAAGVLGLLPGHRLRSPETGLEYELGPLLGEGGYGQVFRALGAGARRADGPLCIKLTTHQQSWLREAYFGALLRGQPRAIAVHGCFPWWDGTGRPLYVLVLELAPMGDLRSYFAARRRAFSEARARSQVAGLLEVLQILHRGRALQRDLTPLNVFVCEGPTLKLGDFGIAMHHVRTGGVAATTMAPWMAPPEVLQQRAQTWRAADDVAKPARATSGRVSSLKGLQLVFTGRS